MLLLFVQSVLILLLITTIIIAVALLLYHTVIYIEDHAIAARKKIENIILTVSVLHIFLLFRSVNIFQIVFSLSVQYIFYHLLLKYPNFGVMDPYLIVGTVLALVNHFLVLRLLILNYWVLEVVVYFFVFVWLTPFCFYVSLSANDEVFVPVRNAKRETLLGRLMKGVMNRVRRDSKEDKCN